MRMAIKYLDDNLWHIYYFNEPVSGLTPKCHISQFDNEKQIMRHFALFKATRTHTLYQEIKKEEAAK